MWWAIGLSIFWYWLGFWRGYLSGYTSGRLDGVKKVLMSRINK